jgi:hypothetical protein
VATLITTLIPSGGLVMQLLIVASFNILFQGINGLGFRVMDMDISSKGMDFFYNHIKAFISSIGLESKCYNHG